MTRPELPVLYGIGAWEIGPYIVEIVTIRGALKKGRIISRIKKRRKKNQVKEA